MIVRGFFARFRLDMLYHAMAMIEQHLSSPPAPALPSSSSPSIRFQERLPLPARTALVFLVLMFLCAPPASAQAREYETISPSEFAMYARWLDLSADEVEEHTGLLQAYRAGFVQIEQALALLHAWDERLAEEGIDRVTATPPQPMVSNRNVVHIYSQSFPTARRERLHLERRYIEMLRRWLPDRVTTIRSIEYRRARSRMLTPRTDAVRNVPDVIVLLDRAAPDVLSNPDARPIIERYEREIDRLLDERIRQQPTHDEMTQLRRDRDDDGLVRAYAAPWLNTMRIRNATRDTVRSLRPFMSEQRYDEFEDSFIEGFYPPRHDSRLDATISWLIEQPGLTDDERRQVQAIRDRLDKSFDEALPNLRRRYDAFFTRDGAHAYAREVIETARRDMRHPTEYGPETEWNSRWLSQEMATLPEHFADTVREVSLALSQRDDALARGEAPEQGINDPTFILWRPWVSAEDVFEIVDGLDLADGTIELISMLYRQFHHVFMTENQRVRLVHAAIAGEAQRRFTDRTELANWSSQRSAENERQWAEFRRSYEAQLRDEVAMVLEDEHDRLTWIEGHNEAYLRSALAVTREHLGHRRLFDVVSALDRMGLLARDGTDEQSVELARMYRAELRETVDQVLVDRTQRNSDLRDAMVASRTDPEVARVTFARLRAVGDPIERLNDQWVVRLRAMFPGREQEFDRAVQMARYRGVYRVSPAERAFELLLDEAEGLDESIRAQLDALRLRFDIEHATARSAMVQAIDRFESSGPAARQAAHDAVIDRTLRQQRLVERACADIRRTIPAEVFNEIRSDVRVLVSWIDSIDD